MIVYTSAQGSPEWRQQRAAVITGSRIVDIRKTLKNGNYSKAAIDYAQRLAVERISGDLLEFDEYETWAMRRGRELEEDARLAHEERIGQMIEPVGFITSDCGKYGVSADGLIHTDGGSEYKCFTAPSKILPIILNGDLSDVMDQVQAGMWITGREWWHFALYCPALASIDRSLTLFEVYRDEEYIAEMVDDLRRFNELVEETVDTLESLPANETTYVSPGGKMTQETQSAEGIFG